MSAAALQRVVVRMLHDPDLDRATRGAALTATERSWLARVDPRRWRADRMRRSRLLHALIEEYPVSVALKVRAAGVPAVDAFFQSARFHQSVQRRGVLALDFGDWLATGDVAPFAEIERAIAQVRRFTVTAHPADPSRRWQLAPWIALGRGPLDSWQALRDQLAQHPDGRVGGILDATFGISRPSSSAPCAWLVDGGTGLQVEALPEALFAALDAVRRPQRWAECLRAMEHAGADPADADDVLRSLIDDVLLTVAAD